MNKKKQDNNGGNLITNYMQKIPKDINRSKQKTKNKQNHASKGNTANDYHQSSRQQNISSKTELINSESEEFEEFRQQSVKQKACHQMIMIGPMDTTYYRSAKKRIQNLLTHFNKAEIIKFILDNAKFSGGITNLKNLQNIDNKQFWESTVKTMLRNVIDDKKQKLISCTINILLPNSSQISSVTKAQIYMILISMFFCIFPQQSHKIKNSHFSFAQLMSQTDRDTETSNALKQQKLKCLINYFNKSTKCKFGQLQKTSLQIQRTSSNIDSQQYRNIEFRLKQVDLNIGLVQERYKYDIIVDFANKKIGGGVLGRGAVQEEILFLGFPELIAVICFTHQMRYYQAIIIYGAERYNLYSGYSDTFKFQGDFQQKQSEMGPFKSVIIAVDATDFKSQGVQNEQYSQFYVQKQLKKFLTGIQGTDYDADQQMAICTGKWGCGAFGGDKYLKFLIQWIACSVANKNMRFMCSNQEQKKQFSAMVNFMKKFNTLQIIQVIDQYGDEKQHKMTEISFIDFIKKYIC